MYYFLAHANFDFFLSHSMQKMLENVVKCSEFVYTRD